MRLHRIELTGFGPFRHTQTVDFDAFAADGIFLIGGRTGAGKSSILDGVTFALYGGVPRYEGGEKRVRCDHCEPADPTEVRLEFTVGERRLRVTRSPDYERPAKRGGGMTTAAARAELEELVDGDWRGLAARPRDVGLLLDEILGLNQSQFQQVILLAQNRFSRFLLASNADRQALLRTLFDSRRFEQYRDELEERRREAQRRAEAAGTQTRTLLGVAEGMVRAAGLMDDAGAGELQVDDGIADAAGPSGDGIAVSGGADTARASATTIADRIAAVERAVERADYRAQVCEQRLGDAHARHEAAATEHARVAALWRAQQDLARVRVDAAEHEAQADVIAVAQAELDAARAAEVLRPVLAALQEAEVELAAAAQEREHARAAWEQTGAGDPAEVAERLTGELAVWAVAAAQEQRLESLQAEARRALEQATASEAELTSLVAEQETLPGRRDALEAELAPAAAAASTLPGVRAERDAWRDRLAAAHEAQRLRGALDAAEESYATAVERSAATAATVAELLRRRLRGHAAELAAGLVAGDACPVCGAVEHPHPAPATGDPVTEEAFAAAEAARDAAAAVEVEARDAAATARDEHTDVHARAGGLAPDVVQTELGRAESALAAAEQAETRRTELVAEMAGLRDHETGLADRVHEVRARLAVAHQAQVVAAERAAAVSVEIDAARGEHESVAARIADAERVRDTARRLLAADEAHDRAGAARQRQAERAAAELAASPFADAPAARDAVRSPEAQSALAHRIAAHAAALAAVRSRQLELELELTGTEPADPDAARETLAAADAARTAAISAHHDAVDMHARLRELAVQLDEAQAATGQVEAEAAMVGRLADTVAGRAPNTMKMDLETFVLAAELEEIVAAANVRLAEMSAGRYTLLHTDARAARGASSGLGIEVLDAHTGRARPPQSLSGGETFLASLALALGLAEVVTARAGGIRLDTLFIDEGFGSLDAETLELAMRTLDELRAGGRVVGVISHVEAMQEQLGAQLRVEATPNGPSEIHQVGAVSAAAS